MPHSPYLIKYTVDYGKFTPDDIKNRRNQGLTGKMVVISLVEQPDGSCSLDWTSYNGNLMRPMDNFEVYVAWIKMAESLAQKPDLDDGTRMFIKQVYDTWHELVHGPRVNLEVKH